MIPSFAVVGRTNKGKSSLVATLIENDRIGIAATPRTTTRSQGFTFKIEDKELFAVYDTPGFEEAPAILEWLKSVPVAANQRASRVREFYETFHKSDKFRYECELLRPILDGAAILYVADASHPYRPNFESEFEILQWTGQPSMALLNHIGDGRYESDWQRALEQYFRKVRVFNAHSSWIQDRIHLIEELSFLSDAMSRDLKTVTEAMRRQLRNRLRDAAGVVSQLIRGSLHYELRLGKLGEVEARAEHEANVQAFFDGLRRLEMQALRELSLIFGFRDLAIVEAEVASAGLDHDLFSKETWEILGLTRKELLAIGTASGALAGGTLDALVGGASFMVGTGIGGLLGSLSSAYLAYADPEIAGFKLSRKKRSIGPYRNPNFPWVLLDRQLAFIHSLLRRTHAQRTDIRVEAAEGKQGPSSQLKTKDKTHLNLIFQSIRWNLKLRSFSESLELEISRILIEGMEAEARSR